MIRVKSKREGFRRCGHSFSKAPMLFSDDHFSKKEMAALKAEPMLEVERGDFDTEEKEKPEAGGLSPQDQLLAKGLDEANARIKELADANAGMSQSLKIAEASMKEAGERIEELEGLLETERTARAGLEKRLAEKSATPEEDRAAKILAAARLAVDHGDTIGSGAPKVEAMEEALGFNITATERDAAWEQLQAGKE